MKMRLFLVLVISTFFFVSCSDNSSCQLARWSEEKANEWYASKLWPAGCNYIPSDAVNTIEMWHEDTYNPALIDKELTWAEDLGFNTVRVFLNLLVYEHDPEAMKARLDDFLSICEKHHLVTALCLFDDCFAAETTYGPQPENPEGQSNTNWAMSPTVSSRKDTLSLYPRMEKYEKDILSTFSQDERVLIWDLWNEPGNSGMKISTLPLLKKTFQWAREVNPSQPITSGIWLPVPDLAPINSFLIENSDVISYHSYASYDDHSSFVNFLKMLNRPLFCTEYMARITSSYFSNILPLLKENKIAAFNWGFVQGKTNTIYPLIPKAGSTEPTVWNQDFLYPDGSPFDPAEIETIKSLTK